MAARGAVGRCALVLGVAWFATAVSAQADPKSGAPESAAQVWEQVRPAFVQGPAAIPLGEQASLALPAHYAFLPRKEAARLLAAGGNMTGDDFLGLIVPATEDRTPWFVTVRFDAAGYVKDDDAKHWDADKLLQNLKDGTEAQNATREASGIPPFVVTRWVEVPAYAPNSHQLVWSVEVRRKNGEDKNPGVNYNTYLLGREGYMSLDLVTSLASIEADKPAARELLDAVHFNNGKQYADFKPSTDKVAAYGLAALIAGVAAKKLGLLALFAATIVKFAKVIALAVAGALAVARKWFKGRNAPKDPTA